MLKVEVSKTIFDTFLEMVWRPHSQILGSLRPLTFLREATKALASTVVEAKNPKSSKVANMGIYGLGLTF